MGVRQDIAYLIILLMLAGAVAGLIMVRRARRRERRQASEPIRLVAERTESPGE